MSLRADGFATLSAELGAVLASKKRAPAAAAVAENAPPNAGVSAPPAARTLSSRLPRASPATPACHTRHPPTALALTAS